jgi:hypothetical protein
MVLIQNSLKSMNCLSPCFPTRITKYVGIMEFGGLKNLLGEHMKVSFEQPLWSAPMGGLNGCLRMSNRPITVKKSWRK